MSEEVRALCHRSGYHARRWPATLRYHAAPCTAARSCSAAAVARVHDPASHRSRRAFLAAHRRARGGSAMPRGRRWPSAPKAAAWSSSAAGLAGLDRGVRAREGRRARHGLRRLAAHRRPLLDRARRIRRRPDRRARRRAHRHDARGDPRARAPSSGCRSTISIATEPAGSEALFFFDGAPYTIADVDRDFAAVRPRLAADAKIAGRRPADVSHAHRRAAAARPHVGRAMDRHRACPADARRASGSCSSTPTAKSWAATPTRSARSPSSRSSPARRRTASRRTRSRTSAITSAAATTSS